jgi:hypothetical protein
LFIEHNTKIPRNLKKEGKFISLILASVEEKFSSMTASLKQQG